MDHPINDSDLALENKMLFMKYNDNTEDIMKAQESIKDISQVIGRMSETLHRQDLTTDQSIHHDSW